jgi:hypothetical protein
MLLEADATPADNVGTLTQTVLPSPPRKLTVAAVAARIVAGQQIAYVKLSRAARVTAQFYVKGKAQPIGWRRSLPAGTTVVRITLPAPGKGAHFSVVLRAVSGKSTASTKLKLVAL